MVHLRKVSGKCKYLLLNKCFILDKQQGGQCCPSSYLQANVIGKFQINSEQPYVRLTSKFKIARKETLLKVEPKDYSFSLIAT